MGIGAVGVHRDAGLFLRFPAINIEAVRGNRFMSPKQAIRFALRRFPQLFLSELSIALFVAVIVLLFVLLGLVSRIPYVGEWLYIILFAVPNFIIALICVFILFCVFADDSSLAGGGRSGTPRGNIHRDPRDLLDNHSPAVPMGGVHGLLDRGGQGVQFRVCVLCVPGGAVHDLGGIGRAAAKRSRGWSKTGWRTFR